MLLIAVFFLDRSHATHRWIRLGPFSFQPSELAKLALIIFLAWFLESRRAPAELRRERSAATLAPALGTVLLMAALVVKEPDMGTACMILLIAMVMLYVAGLSYNISAARCWPPFPPFICPSSACRTACARRDVLSPELDPQAAASSCCNRSSPLVRAALPASA